MSRLKDRLYGMSIGGAIGNAMGEAVKYSCTSTSEVTSEVTSEYISICNPYDTKKIGIQPGYWTEPTSIWLKNLGIDCISTGVYCDCIDNATYSPLMEGSASVIKNYGNPHIFNVLPPVSRFWAAIIDTALHDGSKSAILTSDTYNGFKLPDYCLKFESDDPALIMIANVLNKFQTTNNYSEGLSIINESICPSWAGALYGQLAGAYYGLTDIDETWMDCVQMPEILLSAVSLK